VSYAGLDPVDYQSGEEEIYGCISKEGSAQLRLDLVQAVHTAVKCHDYFRNFYKGLKHRKSPSCYRCNSAEDARIDLLHALT